MSVVCKGNCSCPGVLTKFLYAHRDHQTQAVADTGVFSWVPVVTSVVAGFSASGSPLVVASADVSVGSGTWAASLELAEEEPFWARLAFRRRPPKPPEDCFLPSPSVNSLSDVAPVLRSFFVPRLPKKEVRRLSAGDNEDAPAAGAFVSAAVVGISVLAAVGSAVDEVTGLSSCGAVDDTVDGSSFAGTVGAVSAEPRVVASFLPKILPKIEFLLFGFGAVSRAVEAGVVSVAADSVPAIGAVLETSVPVVAPPAGTTGSPITRDAMSSQAKCSESRIDQSTYQQQRRQNRPSW